MYLWYFFEVITTMQKLINKAQTLVEALPYIKDFHGKTVVVKYGGSLGKEDLSNFARDLALMKYVGIKPVVVHGGGPQIAENLKKQGIESQFISGLRVTDEKTMEVVEMVLVGKVNQEITSAIQKQGVKAVGLSGKDGKSITAKKADLRKIAKENGFKTLPEADLGMVGEVKSINPLLINTLENNGYIPVIAPIGCDKEGNTYNINADHVAGKIAGALKAAKLILLTNVPGILDKNKKLISSLTEQRAKELIENETISKGMIPKVTCAVESLHDGVEKVHIIDGTIPRAVILEIFTDSGIGTEIKV